MKTPLRVLLVEDSPDDAELLLAQLRRSGYEPSCERVQTAETMRAALAAGPWDLVLSDHAMPCFSAPAALNVLKASGHDLPFIVVSGTIGEEVAVAAIREGAADYLLKDRLARLGEAVRRALETTRLRREQQALQEAFLEMQTRYRHIFENAIEGIYRSRPDGGLVLVNPAMARILGYPSPEELITDRCDGRWCGYADPHRRAQFQRHLEEAGVIVGFESEVVRRDGRHIWVKENARVVRDAGGGVAFYDGTLEDITERREAERRIREQAELLDRATDAIYVRSLDGVIEYWNEGAERLFGWSRAEALGATLASLHLQELDPAVEAQTDLTAVGGWSGERRHLTKVGREIQVFSRFTVVRDDAGQPTSVFAINTDITEKKQLEARALQAQRLDNLGALAGGLAHDLNNVLAPVLMATQILKLRLPDALDRKMIATMEASAQRGADIVRQVLTFARGIEGEKALVQVRHLLREMVDIATETFPPAICVRLDAPKDLWPVLGDATQIHQVLMNLCINARDAMPQGGSLILTAANLQLDQAFAVMTPDAKPGPYLCISVSDTGTGIAPEHAAKIFEPFFTTKEKGKGTGLGLATVLGITKSHGGFLRFHSELGRGTRFEVFLPAQQAGTAAAEPPPPIESVRGAGQVVLVVDDEPAIRTVAAAVLEDHGYQPVGAGDGIEAIAVYMRQADRIAAVVTNMTMPGMDGPTLVRTLRRIAPSLPVLGISGAETYLGSAAAEATGVSAMLRKPFTASQLVMALHDLLHPPPEAQSRSSRHPWATSSSSPFPKVSPPSADSGSDGKSIGESPS